ncbi:MAG: sulfatase-like hydrolase/transferase [Proteobacteria bacterium]|nr:sulfatase-like hydrolase/transferase [Pseudomonadota bacterium]
MGRSLWTAVSTMLAVVALNALLVVGDFIEARSALIPTQVSLELVAVLVLLSVAASRGARLPDLLLWLLGLMLLAVLLLRFADMLVPWYFGREFSLAVDLKFLPVLIDMVYHALTSTQFALLAGIVLGIVALAVVALRLALGAVWRGLVLRQAAPFVLGLTTVALGWVAAVEAGSAPRPMAAKAVNVVQRSVQEFLNVKTLRREIAARMEATAAARPSPADLAKLGGRNVLLVFAESYGAVTLTDPAMAKVLDPVRAEFAAAVQAHGYRVASGFLESPVTGGGSWLAHATMTTGIKVDGQLPYDALLLSRVLPLAGSFRAAGYRTVAAMPRINQPWPEARFFGFETVYDGPGFGYLGPRYTWETMPDQFVLEAIHRRELAERRRPVFVQYVLSSSHAPFDDVPPLIGDWAKIGDGRGYNDLGSNLYPLKTGLVFEHVEGYVAATRYVLQSLQGYLTERLADDSLVIIVGDHQPPLTVAAATRDKAVVVHVLSRDPALVAPFLAHGFTSGVRPDLGGGAAPMAAFLGWFVEDFSGAPRERN